jgi:hypothetical protein
MKRKRSAAVRPSMVPGDSFARETDTPVDVKGMMPHKQFEHALAGTCNFFATGWLLTSPWP